MHVPDGFLDAPDLGRDRRGRRGLRRRRPRQGPPRARRQDRADGRPGRGVHLRHPDAQLPGRRPAPAATCWAGRSRRCSSGRAPAVLCMSVVFIVQCLLFADGGITALGTNITLMGLTTVVVGWLVFKAAPGRAAEAALAGRRSAAGIGALVSVPVAALALRRPLRGRRHRRHPARQPRRPRWSACTC